jgi:hypothetical protein
MQRPRIVVTRPMANAVVILRLAVVNEPTMLREAKADNGTAAA